MELNVQGVNDVRQTEIRTVEPLVLFCTFEVDVTVGKLSRCKSPGIDQIPAELIRAVWNILRSEIHKRITCMEYGKIATAVERIRYCT